MKKILLFAAILFAGFMKVEAQNDFRFGIQAALPSISWMTSNDKFINSKGSSLGVKFGVMGEYYFMEDRYAITGGIGFAFNQGGTLLHDIGGNFWSESSLSNPDHNAPNSKPLPDGVKLKYSLQYLEIPVGLKLKTAEMGYIRYFAELPIITIGMNTAAKGDIESGSVNIEDENIYDDVNFLNLFWGLGVGVEYSVGPSTSLIAGIYYQQSFIDVTSDDGYKVTEFDDAGTPLDLSDDSIISKRKEDSKGNIGSISLRIGVLF